ncbi:MAG: glycosyltransferase family 2 protein [Planctomycetota bacterium]|jgi:glycosyltransferase involved in cell wall biosynthesis
MSAEPRKRLVVMMSALNEEKSIGRVIDEIPLDLGVHAEVRTVVVDDGSTDATARIAREKGAIVLQHEERMGLGKSFADGLERALGERPDIIVNIDADGQFDPQDIPALIRPILEGRADFVTATRFARADLVPRMRWLKKWGNRQMCRLVNFATGTTSLTDVSCGFRAYSLKAALHVQLSGRFTHVQETIIDLANKGLRIAEVPLRVRGERQFGRSRIARSLPRYAWRAGGMVLRTFCRTRPLFFFGLIGGTVTGLGVLQGLAVFVHWCITGRTTPIRALLAGASLFITVGFLVLVLAFVADMLNRVMDVSERQLFFAKMAEYGRDRPEEPADTEAGPDASPPEA